MNDLLKKLQEAGSSVSFSLDALEAAIKKVTAMYPKDAAEPYRKGDEYFEGDYQGIDFSQSNVWSKREGQNLKIYFGAEYRKEVSPSDVLGTYQASSVTVDSSGKVVDVDSGYWEGWALDMIPKGAAPKIEKGADWSQVPVDEIVNHLMEFASETGLQY